MTIVEKIDVILKERGLSRRQIAIKANIPPSTFQSAMQRNGSMNYMMIQKVARALNCYISELLTPHEESEMIKNQLITALKNANKFKKLNESEFTLTFSSDSERISYFYNLLNDEGKRVAADRVQELTEIPKYQRKREPGKEDAPDEP